MQHVERGVRGEELRDAVVGVLVDDDEAKASVGLPVQGVRGASRARWCGRPSRRQGRSGGLGRLPPPAQATLSRPWPRRSCPSSSPLATPRRRSGRPSGASSARRSRISSWSWSTTAPSTARATCSLRSRTSGSGCSGTRSRSGLAGALNAGLDVARGTHVARMDADDVALPGWLERVVGRIRSLPSAAVVGAGTIDLHAGGALGRVHRMPVGARAIRWAALFSSPFFHPTVVVDRAVLERHELRYDTSFAESEDYDLWARLLDVADGDNVPAALVLYRRHDAQASTRRAELQLECRRRVALRQIEQIVPGSHGTARRARMARRRRTGASRRARRSRPPTPSASSWRRSRRDTADVRRAAPRPGRSLEARARRRRAWLSLARPSRSIRRCPWVRCAGWRGGGRPGPSAPLRRGSRPRAGCRTGPADDRPPGADAVPDAGCSTASRERPDLDLTVVYAAAARSSGGRGASTLRSPCGLRRRQARAGRVARASARLPAVPRDPRRATRSPTRRSSSSPAGARSLRRQRSPGAGGTASPTCSSSSRTSATPGPAGGGP